MSQNLQLLILICKFATGLYLIHIARVVISVIIIKVFKLDNIPIHSMLSLKCYTTNVKNKYIELAIRIILTIMIIIGLYFVIIQYI